MSASSTTSFNVSSDSAPGKLAMPATLEHGAFDTPIMSSSSESEHEVSFGPTKKKQVVSRFMSPYIDTSPTPRSLGTPASSRGSSFGLRGAMRPGGARSTRSTTGATRPRTSRPPLRAGSGSSSARSSEHAPTSPPATGSGGAEGARSEVPAQPTPRADSGTGLPNLPRWRGL
jgi:hypothetical protein